MANPYAKRRTVPAKSAPMGRQSQQRVSQKKRTYQYASNSKKKRKGDQLTLEGQVAFVAARDCNICVLKALAKTKEGVRVPKRAHDDYCPLNTTTKGKGPITNQAIAAAREEKRLKDLFQKPLQPHEKGSWQHSTKAAGAVFFDPMKKKMGGNNKFKRDNKVNTATLQT